MSKKNVPFSRLRKGPAGKGKYYTQIHGDTSYNRKKSEQDASDEIEQGLEDLVGGDQCDNSKIDNPLEYDHDTLLKYLETKNVNESIDLLERAKDQLKTQLLESALKNMKSSGIKHITISPFPQDNDSDHVHLTSNPFSETVNLEHFAPYVNKNILKEYNLVLDSLQKLYLRRNKV